MKLRFAFLRREPGREGSRLTPLLPKVQALRESCEWQPVVGPEAIDQREQRVSEARKRILYQPIPFDRDPERSAHQRDNTKTLTWILGVLVASALVIFWLRQPKPAFLSDQMATENAWQALQESGIRASDLKVITRNGRPTVAPNGILDCDLIRLGPNTGVLMFERTDRRESYQVSVSLQDERVICIVITNRLKSPAK